jgi:ribosomal protein S8
VNANCTGNLTVDAGQSGIVHRDLVIVDAGREVEFVSTDQGVVIGGYMKKQRVGGE